MKKLFVGNLSWKATEENLKALFEKYGQVVSIRIIVDQYTGKSKGFGFVEMDTVENAQKAIAELNEKPFMDRNLRVSAALERQERAPGERSGGGGGGDRGSRGGNGRSFRGERDGEYRHARSRQE